jgi:hypothetical protein
MPQLTFLEKLQQAPPRSFHELDPAKARRMNARSMVIPAPEDVARRIAAIPAGETRTISALRAELAALGGAETACPAATNKYWKWIAHAEGEVHGTGSIFDVPWWRVLKDGKLSRHMPGGIERQAALLRNEGVSIK